MAPRRALLLLGTVVAAGCSDATSPGALTLVVQPASRSVGIDQDSITVVADSVVVVISGSGASSARWTATHDSADGWLTFVTAAGTGSGAVRWVLNPIYLPPATYVDTLVITAGGAAGSPVRVVDSLTVRGTAGLHATVREAVPTKS